MARVGAVQICPEWKPQTLTERGDGLVDVGVVEDDAAPLPPELEQHPLHGLAARLEDAGADRGAAGELTMSTSLEFDERLAHLGPRSR